MHGRRRYPGRVPTAVGPGYEPPDVSVQVGGPLRSVRVRVPPAQLLGDARVPDAVQVGRAVVPAHVDAVAAAGEPGRVQRLVDIGLLRQLGCRGCRGRAGRTEEVDHPFQRHLPLVPRARDVERQRRVVCDRRHDASALRAVARHVEAARVRRRVVRVDIVPRP